MFPYPSGAVLHFGHRICLPAADSGALSLVGHPGHGTTSDILTSPTRT